MHKITVIDRAGEAILLESQDSPAELFADVGRKGGWLVASERVPGEHGGYKHQLILINGAEVRAVREGWPA
jgi:hypothetical protein